MERCFYDDYKEICGNVKLEFEFFTCYDAK